MALDDVYQVIDESEFQGQKCLNVYFYQQTTGVSGEGAEGLADEYIATFLNSVTAFQNVGVVHTSIKVNNLFTPSDTFEALISEAGNAGAGDVLGTFEAIPFRMTTDNGEVRPGSKRYAGVDESFQTDGVITDAGILASLVNLATDLAAPLLYGALSGTTASPVVVKRILEAGLYRLPENLGETVVGLIIDALFSPLITSQVSRKVGRGE